MPVPRNNQNSPVNESNSDPLNRKIPDGQLRANNKIMDHIIRKYKPTSNMPFRDFSDPNLTEE